MTHIVFLIASFFSVPALNQKNRPKLIFLSFCVLFLFLALRYQYGNDYMSYYQIHADMNDGTLAWGSNDIFFKQLNLLFSNFYLMVAIVSLFYIFTLAFLITRNLSRTQYWMSLLILLINPYLFLTHLSSFRQTIAICFVIFAVHFAVKRKLMQYLVFIAIAAGFHRSALILLPLYFLLTESKIGKRGFVVTYGLVGILLVTPLFETIVNRVLLYFPSYDFYVEQGLHNTLRSTLISSFFFFLVMLNINKLEGKEIIYGKLALCGTILSLLAIKLSMLTRVQMYFDIFLIVAIPLIFTRLKLKISKRLLFIVMIAIYLLRYVAFFDTWATGYSTYKTIYDVSDLSK